MMVIANNITSFDTFLPTFVNRCRYAVWDREAIKIMLTQPAKPVQADCSRAEQETNAQAAAAHTVPGSRGLGRAASDTAHPALPSPAHNPGRCSAAGAPCGPLSGSWHLAWPWRQHCLVCRSRQLRLPVGEWVTNAACSMQYKGNTL